MNNMKKLLAMLLAMTLVLCLAACGGNGGSDSDETTTTTTAKTEPQQTEPTEENDPPVEPVEFVYTVTVEDEDGNPIEGVFVQICAGTTCVPKATDANGVAGYDTEITGDGELTAKIINVPEGYIPVDGVTEIVMGDETDVVFMLQAETANEDDYVYTVTVEDIDGNPVEGAWVQICAGTTCVPKMTDANGFAGYDSEITGDGELVAKLISLPEAYSFVDLSDGWEISMADGSVNVSFILESVPGSENETDGGDYVYTVQVITIEDFGVEGAWVQICAGNTCVPKQTDANGMAGYDEEIVGDGELVAKLISIPEGYELCDEEVEIIDGVAQITLAEDMTDVLFVLREIS